MHYSEIIRIFDRIIYASCSWGTITVCDCEKRTYSYLICKKIRQFSASHATDDMLVTVYSSIHKYTCSNGIKRGLIPTEIKERCNELFRAAEDYRGGRFAIY